PLCASSPSLLACRGRRRPLASFPTRRSSDLAQLEIMTAGAEDVRSVLIQSGERRQVVELINTTTDAMLLFADEEGRILMNVGGRSEEHTSELQSRFDLVCRLLLEKKKRKTTD